MNQLVQHFWVQITSPMVDGSGMQGIGECQDLSFQHQNLEKGNDAHFHNRQPQQKPEVSPTLLPTCTSGHK